MANRISKAANVEKDAILEAPVSIFGACHVRKNCAIGQYSFLNGRTTLYPGTKIGRYCSIGVNCEIGAPSHPIDRVTTSPITYDGPQMFPRSKVAFTQTPFDPYQDTIIGSDVWVGSMVVILGGVRIGHGAVIAAGAVVTKDVPPYTIVGGTPAREIRKRFSDEIAERLLESAWWELPPEEIAKLDMTDPTRMLDQLEAKGVR